jgi:hypothetical protein
MADKKKTFLAILALLAGAAVIAALTTDLFTRIP